MDYKEAVRSEEYSYTVHFDPSEEGGFVARVPTLNIATEGDTLDEARAMAVDAIEGHLAVLRDHRWPIPVETRNEQPVSETLKVHLKTV